MFFSSLRALVMAFMLRVALEIVGAITIIISLLLLLLSLLKTKYLGMIKNI